MQRRRAHADVDNGRRSGSGHSCQHPRRRGTRAQHRALVLRACADTLPTNRDTTGRWSADGFSLGEPDHLSARRRDQSRSGRRSRCSYHDAGGGGCYRVSPVRRGRSTSTSANCRSTSAATAGPCRCGSLRAGQASWWARRARCRLLPYQLGSALHRTVAPARERRESNISPLPAVCKPRDRQCRSCARPCAVRR